jgi:octaprenyl-diphosphate synthase
MATKDSPETTNAKRREAPVGALSTAKARLSAALATMSGLDRVESLIEEKLVSDAALLCEIPRYLLTLGGKRMRPALALMVARALGCTAPPQQLIDVAAGIELIHMATLLHDDIIDRSPLRRHQASPFVKFGLESTLLSGDFLLVRAFSLCARLDRFVIDSTERACIELTEGEILEVPLDRHRHTVETSLTIARKKTAALFWLAARTAAHLVSSPPPIVERAALLGEKLGIAFQILDDILDVTSTEDLLGKKAGIDIREKKPSLVNVLWAESGAPGAEVLTQPGAVDDATIERSVAILRASPVIDAARRIALRYTEEAGLELDAIEAETPHVDRVAVGHLRTLIDYTVERME